MSGRSAYVRKKITEPKTGEKGAAGGRGRSKSSGARMSADDASIYDHPMPPSTGLSTANARLLKFSDAAFDGDAVHYRSELANININNSSGSQSGSSENGKRDGGVQRQGPMADYAYARARKPVLKTEDVLGIERSGFRSVVDKKSDDIRKGLTKAFTLGLKKKKEPDVADRAPSSATIRPPPYYDADDYDSNDIPPLPALRPPGGMWDADHQSLMTPPPSSKLPPLPPHSPPPPIKRWIGAGKPAQRWNKLRKDPELWDHNGDVLVYFGRKDHHLRPNPSFRLSSHIIESTESRLLVTLLREGSTEDDFSQIDLPPSPVGAPPMLRHNSYGQIGQATPPVSEDNTNADVDGQISYEMYFPTPANLSKAETHRHMITTRNVFAVLYHASLVGLSLFQALHDLLERLDGYMEPDADNVGTIINYLSARGIDDARNDPETAVSLLAWSETPEVRWEEGWREAFLHCAGMYSRLEDCADFRHLTPITRALLERACLETQLRVQGAAERLADFEFPEAWGPAVRNGSIGKAAAGRLRQFFVNYYARVYGTWPPAETGARTTDGEETWLTRPVAQMLQKDFGALYDYLVNRDIVWDESETRSSRKWMMVSESGNKSFDADSEDLPLTDLLIEFDNRMRFPHIPHPYPLVPDSIPPSTSATPGNSRDRSRKEKHGKQAPDDRNLERRIQLAYTEATNIYSLGSEFTRSDLIEGFVKFEKTDQIGAVDPYCARRGRWVVVYATLQVLASVSVDSPNARYKDGVSYHLSPQLGGTRTPPWKGVSTPSLEASHELSHCWVVPRTWHQQAIDSAGSDTSATSNGTDPVAHMIRSRARQQQKFPLPPPSRSGFRTPSAQSVRSSTTATPTMWGGSSAMSVYSDDTASINGRILAAQQYHGQAAGYANKGLPRPPPRSRGNESVRSDRSANTVFGPGGIIKPSPLNMNSNVPRTNLTALLNAATIQAEGAPPPPLPPPQWPARTQSMYRTQPPAPLDLTSITADSNARPEGGGHIFAQLRPQTPTSSRGCEAPAASKTLPLQLSPLAPDVLAPVIRDFDELESVAEEKVYEKMI
ncbi:hypothetical protein F5B22DRAFT_438123 [Xylaria bambusicola]|uniref:uncharacterized protein n=1 Tax=Xylaria bambusicola TaxID=326684 RepID=UPI002008BEF1|nr:uncharacterized protein F5B22DRAFT_438123 [Xylaria bambusicola]KAI0506635.1 hypothetical protein F5B22DRAFT_438123 [Xylaria bambusicola]